MGIMNSNRRQSDMTALPSKYPQGGFRDKSCRWCEEVFQPKAPSHLYCSQDCADDAHTDNYYKNRYGVTLSEVLSAYEEQSGLCAICKTVGFKMREEHSSGMNLDHCHETGKFRGLLCHNCNRGLGLFQDEPEYLRSAADYLERNYDA